MSEGAPDASRAKGPYPVVVSRATTAEAVLAGASVLASLFTAYVLNRRDGLPSLVGCALLAACVGLVWAVALAIRRSCVFEDRIEQRSILGLRTVRRADVTGWRTSTSAGRVRLTTLTLSTNRPDLLFFIFDPNGAEYRTWIVDLPAITVTIPQLVQRLLEENPALGSRPQVRKARAAGLKALAVATMVLAAAATLIAVLVPMPDPVQAAVGVLPLIALLVALLVRMLRSETLSGQRIGVPPRWVMPVSMVMVAAGLAGGAAILRHNLVDPWTVVLAGAAVGAPFLALSLWLEAEWLGAQRPGFIAALAVLAALWGANGLADINRLADGSAGRVYATSINEMHVTRHRSERTYHVVLGGWAGRHRPQDTTVAQALYEQLHEGEPMCVTEHPGALGFAWFSERPCPVSAA